MEILGVGIPEIIFVIIISLIVLGPKDMQKAGTTIGKWMRDFSRSENWRMLRDTSSKIREIPTKLIRDANKELYDLKKDVNSAASLTDSRRASKASVTRSKPFSPNTIQTPQADTETEPKQNESDSSTNA